MPPGSRSAPASPAARRPILAAAGLVRTWTVRGTVHLLAADDLPLIDALTGPRNRRRFDALMNKRGNLETAETIRPAALEILADGPMTRAELHRAPRRTRACRRCGPHSINVLMPWLAVDRARWSASADGSFRRAEPPPALDADEALATLGRRYLAGYGPAGPEDLARWSGLPITACRRALAAVADADEAAEALLAPGGRARPGRRRPGCSARSTPRCSAGAPAAARRRREDHRLLPGGGVDPARSSSSPAARPAPGSSTGRDAVAGSVRLVRRPRRRADALAAEIAAPSAPGSASSSSPPPRLAHPMSSEAEHRRPDEGRPPPLRRDARSSASGRRSGPRRRPGRSRIPAIPASIPTSRRPTSS